MERAETSLLPGLPAPVRAVVETLAGDGHRAVLVGGCVRNLLTGVPATDFDVATAAPVERTLALFPRAIPIGLHHGTVMLPTLAGPVDVTAFRAGPRLEDDLAHRDFTVNAIAYDPLEEALVDPFDGRADLAKGRLRAVGSAADRFEEDPLRALRGARLVSTHGFEVDPDVARSMSGARARLGRIARERIRRELERLLLGPHVEDALGLLRRSGLEAELAPGVGADAAGVVARLPEELELRLAGWLRGARAVSSLRRMRFPRRTTQRVERLLRFHPIETHAGSLRPGDVRRLLRRVGEENVPVLVSLRRAELGAAQDADTETAAWLDELERAIERVREDGALALRRFDLALDGSEVMHALGCRPGPQIGRALAYLTDRVVEDPSRNTPDGLRALLATWDGDGASDRRDR